MYFGVGFCMLVRVDEGFESELGYVGGCCMRVFLLVWNVIYVE